MRRILLMTALLAIAISATAPWALTAQEPSDSDPTEDQPLLAEKLGKLTLTIDPGKHTAVIKKVLFTPDSKQLITLGMDHSIRIWDVESGQVMKTLYPPGFGGLSAAALSPDGKRLAVASIYADADTSHYLIYLLTLSDGRVARFLKGHTEKIHALAFSADGTRLASSSENSIRIWDPNKAWDPVKHEAEHVFKKKYCSYVALSPDGSRLAGLGKNKEAYVLDVATRKVTAIAGHTYVAWSPDGQSLTTGTADKLHLWDADGKPRWQKLDGKPIHWIRFTQDSRSVLAVWSAAKGNLHATLLDAATGDKLKEFQHKGIKYAAALGRDLSPDGRYTAASGGGPGAHEVLLWKLEDGAVPKRLAAENWIVGTSFHAAWSADGKAVSYNNGPRFHLGDLQFGQPIPPSEAQPATWRQGDLSLEKVAKSHKLKVLKGGKLLAQLDTGESVTDATLVGKDRVAIAGKFGKLWLFDAGTGKVLRRFAATRVRSIAPSPDGRFLLTIAPADQTLRIFSVDREKPLLSLYAYGQDWVLWTPEGYYAATPGGERLMGWTVDNGKDQMPIFYPAERFRKQLRRPDLIKKVFELGSVEAALKALDGAKAKAVDLEKLLPPKCAIELLAHDKGKVTLRIKADAQGQPILGLRLYVDGRPYVPGGKRGIKTADTGEVSADFATGKDKVVNLTWTFTLPGEKAAGAYQVAVVARSKDAQAPSNTVAVSYVNPAKVPAMHVLASGIDRYNDATLNLKFAGKDAKELAHGFQKHAKGELFSEVHAKVLLDKDANRQAILKHIQEVREKVKENDLFVVFFACHGVKDKDQFYLLTVEAKVDVLEGSAISGADLRKALGEFPCQVFLMLDACHSAGFGEKGKLSGRKLAPATDEATRAMTEDEIGVAVMCAAMGKEAALEKDGNGLFTRAVLDALGRAEGVSYNRSNHQLYTHHLQAFVFD